MAKLKPLEDFESDVKTGDIVRISLADRTDAVGYKYSSDSLNIILSASYPFQENIQSKHYYTCNIVNGYEILRRAQNPSPQ